MESTRMLEKFQITQTDILALREVGGLLESTIEQVVADFYTWLEGHAEYGHFFAGNPKMRARVQASQVENWRTFFAASLDDTYFASRRNIATVHARIDLPNDIYHAGMLVSLQGIIKRLREMMPRSAEREQLESSVIKMVFFDTFLVTEEISRVQKEKVILTSNAMQQISTPVLPVWEGVLLLPLMGAIDSVRAQDIMNKTLNKISETSARIFVLDISGVTIVDTAVANQLIRVTKATGLMGCQSIISGISPSIARTLVELGAQLGGVKTTATLRDALDLALKEIGPGDPRNTTNRISPLF